MCFRRSLTWIRSRVGAFALALIAIGALSWLTIGVSPALAQDRDLEDATPAAPAADTAPATDSAGSAPREKTPEEKVAEESLLTFYYNALGLRYTVAFLGISFWFVALAVMNFLAMRRDNVVPAALVEQFEALLNEKRYQEAYELAKNDESYLGKVLSAGLAKLSAGYPQALEAMEEVGQEESLTLEQRLSYIALIGTIAPMVGLLGTVDGMVASFRVIANSDTQPKPSELAQGISMALITTLVGLVLAIPAIGMFGYWKNRLARLILEVGILSEGLMSRFQNVSGGKKA